MAGNFRITVHQNSDDLHLRLEGDFDGNAALELLKALEKRCPFASRTFIHTNGLRQIYPSGSSVFRSHLCDLKPCEHMLLHFTGDHAEDLRPEKRKLH